MENGRIKILSDLVPTGDIENDKVIIPRIIAETMSDHKKNVADMKRLKEYYYNKTDVRNKQKTQQPHINNKIGIDYASIIVTTINAYCFANPFTVSSRNSDKQDMIKQLNDSLNDDNYSQKTMHTALDSGIYGVGYKFVRPATPKEKENGVYFKTFAEIDPLTTYCVYANTLEKEKILAVRFYDKPVYDESFRKVATRREYDCWTKYHQWHFIEENGSFRNTNFSTSVLGSENTFEAYPLVYERIPIIEYERKQDRTSDFELALDLINAVNALASARVDAVEQKSDYLLLLRDIDIWSDGALDRVKRAIKEGILAFQSTGSLNGVQPDVDVLDIQMNQSEIQTLQDFLTSKLEEVAHVPNRDSRTSGSDTGMAVEGRNGYRSLENIAGLVTSCALESENEMFDVILQICKRDNTCPFNGLTTKDIEVKSNRNKVENMINSTQAYSTLRSAGMCDTEALVITNLTPDPISTARLNEEAKKKEFAESLEQERQRKAIESEFQNKNNNQELGGTPTGA